MKLDTEFIRLPLAFDAERLADEISRFEEKEWRPHPQGNRGNSALPLIAAGGDPFDDAVRGPMLPTPHLERAPYLAQVLAAFHAVLGRTRLMRLDAGAEATPHSDTNYYWTQHARIHVPIVTGPEVEFLCGGQSVHMAAGESWIFDTWKPHNVLNPRAGNRVHLVADTVGSAEFWQLVAGGRRGDATKFVAWDPLRAVSLATETFNHPLVMSPHEMADQIAIIESDLGSAPEATQIRFALAQLSSDWRAAWARFGERREGWPLYRQLLKRARATIEGAGVTLANRVTALHAFDQVVMAPALDEQDLEGSPATRTRRRARGGRFDRPVFIVCSPRSGSTMLFETLQQSPSVWTVGGESHAIIERVPGLSPAERRHHSNRLTEADADPSTVAKLEDSFLRNLRNARGQAPRAGTSGLRLLEKTPKNSLRVPFLAEAFPDALFIYLYRDMRDTISSMLDAWRSGKFVTYRQLPGWEGPPWSLLLTPGWRDLAGKSLPEIVASQWSTATRYLLDDLEQLAPERWCVATYDALVGEPQKEIERLAAFVGIDWNVPLGKALPLSKTTLTPPDREKWRRNAADLEIALPLVSEVAARARALFATPPLAESSSLQQARGSSTSVESNGPMIPVRRPAADATAAEFRSSYTPAFTELLTRLASSLIVTTYQSGRVIVVRAIDGRLNTHLRAFPSPMGVAVQGNSLTLGTRELVWSFREHAGVRATVDGGRADAVFVPVSAHATGNIAIHELAWAGRQLVLVNTRFSCLATLDRDHSFVPIWQPSFITELVSEDRCHLNGVAIADGAVRYVTALGESNAKGGWRERKADGGIVIDVTSGEIVARGLSMPHSPRWHEGKLWLLESGEGRLCTVDPSTGAREVRGEVPGFARGLAFAGPYAFVGLSQVRESVFDGIPIAKRTNRSCGIWVVDTRDGSTAAFLRFEGVVQEIFDVQLLAGLRHPDILEPGDPIAGAAITLPAQFALSDAAGASGSTPR